MKLILERSKYLKSQDLKRTTVIEILRSFLHGRVPEEGTDEETRYLQQIDILVKEIEQDKEFMASVMEAVRTGERNDQE